MFTDDFSYCVYRSKDPVKNFKIKVALQKATGKSYLSKEEFDKETKNRNEQAIGNQLHNEKEELTIKWQTKIFSKREFLKYTMPDFTPTNILEENYKEECLKLKEANYHPGRIFTYVDSDPYEFYEEINAEVNHAPKSVVPSYLERNDVQMRKRKPLLEKSKQSESRVARMNIVNYKPLPDESRRYQSKIIPFHTMYIMADLSNEKHTFTMNDECVLCCIKIDSNGAIVMKPSFSDTSYFVQTGGFARETYEYFLEHVSSKIAKEDLFRELRLHKELYLRHSNYIKNLVGSEFKFPVQGVLKVHVFGEIRCAKNFDYDDLHVYYQLDLPTNWHVDRLAPISGFTQTSRTKTEGKDEVAYFSHPFEFDLYYKNDEDNFINRDELPKMPKILFEVASYDSWKRYRTEGYTWTQISSKPGVYQETLNCWRPRGDSLLYELRRFFIGGSPELEDITYAAIPSNQDGSILSRLGFRTVTTGTLSIKLNTVFQSQVFLSKKVKKNKNNLLDKIGNYSNLNEFISILEAFNAAKNKMIEARESSRKIINEE